MRKQFLLLFFLFSVVFGCSDKEKVPNPKDDLPIELQLISDTDKRKLIEKQIETEKDSVVRLLSPLKTTEEKIEQYSLRNRYRDSVVSFMRKENFRKYLTLTVYGHIGSGLRKIYFPPLPNLSFYPPSTMIVCENLDPKTKQNLNYEVMVRTKTGWEFYVLGHDLELTNNAVYYQYPADCVSCHYDRKVYEPMFSFSRYLNKQNPITKEKIEYDGILSEEMVGKLKSNRNTLGLFGPYYELMKGTR